MAIPLTYKKSVAAAGIFLIASAALFVSYQLRSNWWQSLLSNLGASLYAALVLIYLYDQVLERQAQLFRKQRNQVAAEQLVDTLRSHIYGTLFPMYRSAVATRPDVDIATWREFLTKQLPGAIEHLDISVRSPASFPQITPYPNFISQSFSRFSNAIESWLTKYGAAVDSDLIDALEQVKNSSFMFLCRALEQFTNFVPPPPMPSVPILKIFKFNAAQCLEYGDKLSNVVEAVEKHLARQIGIFEAVYWRNRNLGIGYARRQLL